MSPCTHFWSVITVFFIMHSGNITHVYVATQGRSYNSKLILIVHVMASNFHVNSSQGPYDDIARHAGGNHEVPDLVLFNCLALHEGRSVPIISATRIINNFKV